MSLTSLDIGHVIADRKAQQAQTHAACPKCRGTKRETARGFGSSAARVLCAECGFEFKENDR